MCDHPGLTLHGIESYIAVPLNRRDGTYFGTLCALDPVPNINLDERSFDIFNLLSSLISYELEAAENEQRREELLEELSTPAVPVWKDVLAIPLIGSLDSVRMARMMDMTLAEVSRTGARHCIIDITGTRIVDSQAFANLANLVAALRLIGTDPVITGVGAHAAQTLVRLGVDVTSMKTRRTLAEALSAIINGTDENRSPHALSTRANRAHHAT